MNKIYDTIFIGFGPATIFSLLKYPQENCLVLEKGKSLKDRDSKETLFGSGGAGAFSDSKLVANPLVGGEVKNIAHISDKEFYDLSNQIVDYYNLYSGHYTGMLAGMKFKWLPADEYEIKSDKLKLIKSKVCHIGTDNSKQIFQSIENHLSQQNEIHFEEEVLSINRGANDIWWDVHTDKGGYYKATNIVIGVGKRSSLVMNLAKQLNLKYTHNKVQIGVRVECPNNYLQELIAKFYDFKIVMDTKLGRWRTFCCCGSINNPAFVDIEQCKNFISCNGSANGNSKANGVINFGLMGELDLDLTIEDQIELMQKVNNGKGKLLAQNIDDFIWDVWSDRLNHKTTVSKSKYRLDNLWDYYPLEVCEELREFILELQKKFHFNGHFFAPEIKLANPLIKMNENFEIHPNIHLIGDCSGYSRGIVQSGIIGMLVGKYLTEGKKKE